jgi:CheY-like chemotaxis protein
MFVDQVAPPQKSILLVDDEPVIVQLLLQLLETANYRCRVALNGAEALEIFQQDHADIDAVMTDVVMPCMNGLELANAVRQIKPEIKLIICSGSLGDAARLTARQLGVDAILPKPWMAGQVLACVGAVLEDGGGASGTARAGTGAAPAQPREC